MSTGREVIQANLVNAGSYRTHHFKRPNRTRNLFREGLGFRGTPPDSSNPKHWVFGELKGWVVGDGHEIDDQEGDYSYFISVVIYLTDRASYVGTVEEGWSPCNNLAPRRDSDFHASDSCDTPAELYKWLETWRHSTATDGAWEKACRTYPPMRQGA